MAYKTTQAALGINPDPEIWVDVKTKEGWYRKKRPKNKRKLNAIMQKQADAFAMTMPATMRILNRLEEFTRRLELGRINATINSLLKRNYLESGVITFKYLLGLDIQPKRKMRQLLKYMPVITVTDEVVAKISVDKEQIRVVRSIYSHYFYELIILWGDPMKDRGLRIDSVESPSYEKDITLSTDPELRIDLPAKKQPWMALFKVSCIEGNVLAKNPRHYAMKVVAVGG